MFIGLDLGTSGLKGLAMEESGAIVADVDAPLSVARPASGWSEQDPAHWIAAAEAVLEALAQQIDMAAVKGIGLSGQMHGATVLGADDAPLRPAILWNDTRSHAQAAAMDGDAQFRRITGNIVFPGFTAPKLAWMAQSEPDAFKAARKVLLPKDYLRLWLTGEHVSEMSDAAGTSWLDTGAREWSVPLLEATGLTLDHMPRLVEGSQVSGGLRAELASRYGLPSGTPVAGGGGDNAASAVGMGIVAPGDAFLSLGTSGVLFAATEGFAPDADTAVHTFCHALPGMWHQMGVILSATDALNWYASLVGQGAEALTAGLGPVQAPGRALFLPYLGGERTPINDAAIRGAFIGLEHGADTAAGTRAVLEGVTYAFRDSLDALAATGTRLDRVTAVGGGAASDHWLQLIATVLGVQVDRPSAASHGAAFGAARLAQMACGAGAEVAEKPAIAQSFAPQTELAPAFAEAHSRYKETYQALRGIS